MLVLKVSSLVTICKWQYSNTINITHMDGSPGFILAYLKTTADGRK